MKLTIEYDCDGPFIQLTEIYSGVSIKTDAGDFDICQRDQGLEIRLEDGPWFSWQEKLGPVKLGPPDTLPVSINVLRQLARFSCEYGEHDSCDPDHGEACPRCWAARLARGLIRRTGLDLDKPSQPKEPPLGALDRFRHG